MNKKLFSALLVLLCLALSLSLFTGATENATTISTAEDLVNLMNTPALWSGNYVLGDNISLTGLAQTSIGNATTAFTGTFDGNGKTITGLSISTGLFGKIDGATVKNLTVEGSVTASGDGTGGVIGYATGAFTVSGVTNKASVTSTYQYTGGIIGNVEISGDALIENCVNYGTISGATIASGIVGRNFSTASYNYTVRNCVNRGAVTASAQAGGVLGRLEVSSGVSNREYLVTGCANYGEITNTGLYTGGVIALFTSNAKTTNITIDNCFNAGKVESAGKYVGGIAGYYRAYANADYYFHITDCYNTAAIHCPASGAAIGGIIGAANAEKGEYTMNNCYNAGSVANGGGTYSSALIGAPHGSGRHQNNYYLDLGETYSGTLANSTMVTAENYAVAETYAEGLATSGDWIITKKGPELVSFHKHDFAGGEYTPVEGGHVLVCYCGSLNTTTEEHTDADGNGVCDVCNSVTSCNHEGTDRIWEVVSASTCSVAGLEKAICANCELETGETRNLALDATNHINANGEKNGNWVADGEAFDYVCSYCNAVLVDDNEQAAVYVDIINGNDDEDGITAETALLTIHEAVSRLSTTGGKLILSGNPWIISGDITDLPTWEKEITITGQGIRVTNHGSAINFRGPTKLEGLTINGATRSDANVSDGGHYNIPVFVANWNDFTVGSNVVSFGACYFVLGNSITPTEDTTNDLAIGTDENGNAIPKVVNFTVERTAAQKVDFTINGQKVTKATPTFDRIYLGDRIRGSATRTVSNVHVNFVSNNATFNNVYLGSAGETTSSHVVLDNFTVSATFNGIGDSYITKFLQGGNFTNTEFTDVYLDKLNLALNGTAYLKNTATLRNIREADITISNGADRYENTTQKLNAGSFNFTKSTAYVPSGSEKISITYGTHSFANSTAYPTYDEIYTVNETVNNECTWDDGVITTEPTADADGVKTYTCTVCGRTKTEAVKFVCTDHIYVLKADNTYYCVNGCTNIAAPTAPAIIAVAPATVTDNTVDVTVSIKTTDPIVAHRFSVDAPTGFTLTKVTPAFTSEVENANGGWIFMGQDDVSVPYQGAIFQTTLTEEVLDTTLVTLTFTVDETVEEGAYVVTVESLETLNYDEEEIDTVAVSAEVTVAAEEEECTHENKTTTSTATCTEGGVETTVCDDCGETLETKNVDAL
ncbi:MAG: hypothetical protein E7598_07845, partial [Ruminococcaceae bacterium]|nr:hypothetical protein [Oscillospiraceae bacterium]